MKKRYRQSHGWISPKARRKIRLKKIINYFSKGFKIFCDNSNLVGYKYITESKRPWFERFFWVIIHITTICTVGWLTSNMIRKYSERSVETAVTTENYPLTNIEFPGIAICNINRISKSKAEKFAYKISSSTVINETYDEILNLLMHLGNLYETAFDINTSGDETLDKILTKYLGDSHEEGLYDITETMKMLSPTCDEGLSSCKLWNETKKCTELFSFRKTQNGFCCTFNYAREPDDIKNSQASLKPKPYVNPSAGQLSGLTVELKPKLNDYFFPFLPTTGFKITIFNPGDYPDNTSGGVSEVLIAPNTESFMKLDASTFYSTEAVRDITLSSRKCLFSDESTVLSAGYTYSDCLVDCRVNEIIRLCECRPFYLPRRGNNENAQRVCDTSDAKCLQQHKKQLWSVQLQGSVNPDANDDSLNCRHCYPACHDVRYTLEISSANLAQESAMGNASILRVSNSSLVHIYFPKFGTIRLKQDIGYYWYELLSDIGGTCGVFIGFSLISVIEFFYIFIRLIWSTVNQRKKIIEISSIETDVNDNNYNNSGNIYWSELMTQPKMNIHSVVVHNRPKFRRY